jgi:hypothetical protein
MPRNVACAFCAVLLLWPTFASANVLPSSQGFVTGHEPGQANGICPRVRGVLEQSIGRLQPLAISPG